MSSAEWEPVIGLEVHAHLKTRTKMFCRCALEYGADENTRTCPVCLAHPGALPVPNERAIQYTLKLGLALDCEIPQRATFARKNYFYPDLPKGYQISQYEAPLCGRGRFLLPESGGDREIGIVRAHLEEDAAKTVHAGGATGRSVGADYSLVDFNRGGTPLLEIVTEPDLRSSDEAMRFLRLLRQTIVELGISDAEMEKGTLRADVNVSVRKVGERGYRPRWEIKNMNSFTFVGRAIEAAIRQQVAAHEAGEEVVQSTYDYDPDTERLTVHRSKEEADDYRYFPEPDLVPVEPPAELVERLRAEIGEKELPADRIRRIRREEDYRAAAELVTTGHSDLYDRLRRAGAPSGGTAHVVMNDLVPAGITAGAINAAEFVQVLAAREKLPRDVWTEAVAHSADPDFAAEQYLAQEALSDESALDPVIESVLAANPEQVQTYLGGKEGVLGYLVGQVMRETQGKADPKVVNRLLQQKLRG
jgi:aspartyl-tRNA(Asn)/glutamyl-tRNA(Gln) amidotransferase subunit B